jgi:hypothetical protein
MILCKFLCKHCRKPIVLPRHTLLREFEHREIPPTEIPLVVLVCNRCKTVESYSEIDLLASAEADTAPKWEAVEELPCVEGSCQFHPTLFVDWSEATTPEAREIYIRNLRWPPLVCEGGHIVPKPEELYGYRL